LKPSPEAVRALFDVNVLIAMLDEQHVHHGVAHEWWLANRTDGWASCPLTQNGFVRIVSQPRYANPVPASFALDLLGQQMIETDHAFWPDHVSILDRELFHHDRIVGPGELTDIYLLALAVTNGGRLATFDRTVPLTAVRGAQTRHIAVI
jgi:toxin-antitoxin system PIN domain toxin